jgi:cobalt/nickel transport system permease protein
VAGFLSVMLSALFIATMLGIQPLIAADSQGSPLFFPFGLEITLPAILIPHFFLAIAEGVLTVLAYRFLIKFKAKLEA